jgi:hypothetical protein
LRLVPGDEDKGARGEGASLMMVNNIGRPFYPFPRAQARAVGATAQGVA